MSKQLDLATQTESSPFSFFNYKPKQTATGLKFNTYAGLRMYLITGSLNSQWLKATEQPQFQKLLALQEPYIQVNNLRDVLVDALRIEIAKRPMIKLLADRKTQVVHTSETKLTSVQEMWLSVVQEVVKGI